MTIRRRAVAAAVYVGATIVVGLAPSPFASVAGGVIAVVAAIILVWGPQPNNPYL